jgi:hypothetical protein
MNEVAVLLGERFEHNLKINHSMFHFCVECHKNKDRHVLMCREGKYFLVKGDNEMKFKFAVQ